MSAAPGEILMLNFLVEDKTPKAVPLDQLLARALRALRTHLGMEVAFVSELRDGRRIFRYVDAAPGVTAIQIGTSHGVEETFCQHVVDLELPELIPDVSRLAAAAELAAGSPMPIGAHLCVPIRLYDGSVYGTLGCVSAKAKPSLNDRDLSMMRVFAELAAENIEADLQAATQRHELAARVNSVLSGDSISLVYQPIFELKQARIVGFESFARFTTTPVRSPDAWFGDAAAVGLDVELELKVLDRALTSFAKLPAGAYVTFNVSPNIVLNGNLGRAFAGAPLERIVLEINEHVSFREYDEIAKVLAPLREKGLRTSVDETGAGISSFRHIVCMKPDVIKLDMSLTRGIESDAGKRAITSSVIQFARDHKAELIAEGVETTAELKALRNLGVMRAQGYLLGRPAPLATAVALCERHQVSEERRQAA